MSEDPSKSPDFSGKVLVVTLDIPGGHSGRHTEVLKNARLLELAGRTFLEGERAQTHTLGLSGKLFLSWDKVVRLLVFDSLEQFMAHTSMAANHLQKQQPFTGLF
jgi:hypothetical protein